MKEQNTWRLPAEWESQSMVQIAWPHKDTDWSYILGDVEDVYLQIAHAVSARQQLLVVTPEVDKISRRLMKELSVSEYNNVFFAQCPTNDTWARDHGFITLVNDDFDHALLDFKFNGWGLKFASNFDNQINKRLYREGVLRGVYQSHLDFVLEGGSIESDGCGTILTTTECLLSENRNETLSREQIEYELKSRLRAERVLWLEHGYLAGDDTDSHIDTLARLCPNNTIAYVRCDDSTDEHFDELKLMEKELEQFTTLDGQPYKLIPLPHPTAIRVDGERLPATYANFLTINGAVLLPVYNQDNNDELAAKQLQSIFPDREIIRINAIPLIRQHGSIHCCTMQFPT